MTTIYTNSGVAWHLDNPSSADVRLADIAHALSQIARFNGHGKYPISVAEHSVFVSRRVRAVTGDDRAAQVGLFHDAHEAYIGDVTTPMKRLLGDAYRRVEAKNLTAVLTGVGITAEEGEEHWPIVAQADADSLAAEKELLFGVVPEAGRTEGHHWFLDRYLHMPWHRARDFFRAEAAWYGVSA